jgi:hypothetical protein
MAGRWDEYWRRIAEWQRAGDAERLALANSFQEAGRYRETNPELRLEMLTRGRAEAQRLNEPWWVLLFDAWRLQTLTSDLVDFTRALPLAMELMVTFNRTEHRAHYDRVSVLTDVLCCYVQVDPIGFSDELERGFAHLDDEVTREPAVERFLLDSRRMTYFGETERIQEAYDLALDSLARAERSTDRDLRIWHGAWTLYPLCYFCSTLGHAEQLKGYAEDMADRSANYPNLRRTEASAWLWLAIIARKAGDEQAASRAFHRGLSLLKGLTRGEEICAGQVATYYELGGDLQAAVGVLDRDLAFVTPRGMLHHTCRVHIARCRLLNAAGTLTPADVSQARQAAAKMRVPDWHLERLGRVVPL